MYMKKLAPVALSALLMGSVMIPVASANEQKDEVEIPQIQIDPVHIFNQTHGTVEDVRVGKDITYYTVKDGEQTNILEITKDTLVYDNTGKKVELKEGDQVVAYTFANKPQKYIYPPQFNPEIIIVDSKEVGFVEVDYFFDDLTNTYDILKLNIGKETELVNAKGKKVTSKDLVEKHLAVFYTASTKSIPAQTTPSKVIVLDDNSEISLSPIDEEINTIIATDYYMVAETTMVPLRSIAEKLGFQVESKGKTVILTKGNESYTITRGEKAFGYNKSLRTLSVAPSLKDTKTYVPVEFIEEYLK
ncbi:copper amine oxidase N-terminal domain-containing protein [Lysinibacillus sp. fkY74-1]|uniref:copper amine oxidase N-terminal domain-containing protein n=1 Tax=Lysinibacillus TaxID=400634 RepID=UPI0004DFC573|nr:MULTISPECIES: copper amine oxidase N-terminal domain-containing protein [Lysinibacillus]MBG9757405.1 copper amine oxidase [Lysinibacillus sphaericus]MBI6863310.1 copper amine oxidase N-terminal domain-containing protein [Lysinibacillus fusiformis]MDM5352503.1 copper amine oxidase N-terminal domain-containing protein [Lysinibacillus sphaericus]PIJ95887.1 copper amine oxidase [Lysinibacillus sphaericus]QIC47267.1 copper amine oxidase N-terminal domain-containing protein [Lysinibacillus sphaer